MDRRSISAACLIAAPAVYGAARFIAPKGTEGTTRQQFAAAAAHPGLAFAAGLLEAVSWWLIVPAAVGVAARLVGRGRALGLIAAVFAVFGSFAFSAVAAINGVLIVLARQPDRAQMIALNNKITSSGYLGLFVVLLFVGLLGEVLLTWAALRGGIVRWWVPALATLGLVTGSLGGSTEGFAAVLVYLPVVVAYVLFGMALLKAPVAAAENVRDRAVVAA